MELVFRMALVLLVDANHILEVPRVLEDDVFRGQLLLNLLDPQMLLADPEFEMMSHIFMFVRGWKPE
jgi:hypothetical protein